MIVDKAWVLRYDAGKKIKSNATFFLQQRENCTKSAGLALNVVRSYEFDCLISWYHVRIANLSDIPKPAPTEWSPRLIDGVSIYVDRHRGLQRTRSQKQPPDIYFKSSGIDKLFKRSGADGNPPELTGPCCITFIDRC